MSRPSSKAALPAPCHYCHGPRWETIGEQVAAHGFVCSWPVMRFVRVPAADLDVGDKVHYDSNKPSTVRHRTVTTENRRVKDGAQVHLIRFGLIEDGLILWGKRRPANCDENGIRWIEVWGYDELLSAQLRPCSLPICDHCGRDSNMGTNRVCPLHWNAWETVV